MSTLHHRHPCPEGVATPTKTYVTYIIFNILLKEKKAYIFRIAEIISNSLRSYTEAESRHPPVTGDYLLDLFQKM